VHLNRALNTNERESGQILIALAVWLPLLLLFVGFAIDFGFGFLTKAELAKAADATSLAIMRNLGRGQTQATAIGQSVFALNAGTASKLYITAPSASVSYSTAPNGEPIVSVVATATIRTYFIGLAGFHSLTISDFSQATRPPIILSLVLDKSGSMGLNGGAQALPPAVQDFLGYFIQGTDQLGEVSFSTAASNDVPITTNFSTPINNSLNSMQFTGGTFAYAGLLDANTQVTGVSPLPTNAVQVVVFFTDGYANMNTDKLNGLQVNYGGCSVGEYNIGWCNGFLCINALTGNQISSMSFPNVNSVATCNGSSTFPVTDTAEIPTNPANLTMGNIGTEADYRAVQYANTMRAAGITVYTIGMGDEINTTYLENLANDPSSPEYNSSLPSGLFEDAPTSGDLDSAFQTVASKIVLRLTQ
jgi:Flp pilus assembly protein TadG